MIAFYFILWAMPMYEEGKLERMLSNSKCHKGRMLHYFPASCRFHRSHNLKALQRFLELISKTIRITSDKFERMQLVIEPQFMWPPQSNELVLHCCRLSPCLFMVRLVISREVYLPRLTTHRKGQLNVDLLKQ
jgi:hypothetical protein